MKPEVFEQTLIHVVEYAHLRDELRVDAPPVHSGISFCGLGDQLLNPHLDDYMQMTADAGLGVTVNTNAYLLDEDHSLALVDVNAMLYVNGGEIGADYERVYGLPFDRIERNVANFLELAGPDNQLTIVLVDHDRDSDHVANVRAHWESVGVTRFMTLDLINRGGALADTHDSYATHPYRVAAEDRLAEHDLRCGAPIFFPFVAYDGRYLLCSSDWKREVVLPTVFDCSIAALMEEKLALLDAGCDVCEGCTHHPRNAVADLLATAGDVDDYVEQAAGRTDIFRSGAAHYRERAGSAARRRIPVVGR